MSKPWHRHAVPSLKKSITLQWPRPPKITQSACISCSGPAANPFLIQSYNLEGLSADLPVQATNGWAKGLHWCALCTALPLPWQRREVFCAFSHFSDVVSTVLRTRRRGKSRDQGIKHQYLTNSDGHRNSPADVALTLMLTSHGTNARPSTTAQHSEGALTVVGISLNTPYSVQGYLKSKRLNVCIYAPTHLYLFDDVQS